MNLNHHPACNQYCDGDGHYLLPELDTDPAALAWASARVQTVIDRCRNHAMRLASDDNPAWEDWERTAAFLERQLVGGSGCVYGAFDVRKGGEPK